MADDIAFAEDGTMAWTGFLSGKVFIRRANATKNIEVATGMSGPNSIAFGKDGRLYVSEVFLGDALYEIDIKNADKPEHKPLQRSEMRKVAEKMGGLNGFEISREDGYLYGPLWFKGQVVKLNVENGTMEVVAEGFRIPAAVNIDPTTKGDDLYVVDVATGEIWSVSLTTKAKTAGGVDEARSRQSRLRFAVRLFVTSMTDNGVYLADKRYPVRGARSSKASSHSRRHRVSVEAIGKRCTSPTCSATAESTAQTGAVSDVLSVHGDNACLSDRPVDRPKHVLLSSWFPTPSRRSTACPASSSPRSATSPRRSMRSRRPTARSMSPSSATGTLSR
jgi:hypothetical protein